MTSTLHCYASALSVAALLSSLSLFVASYSPLRLATDKPRAGNDIDDRDERNRPQPREKSK